MSSRTNPEELQAASTPGSVRTEADSAPQVAEAKSTNYSGLTLSNDFKLQRRLGEGGMGQVYLAEQLSLKRRVAVKLLRSELATDEISRRRFETEAKAVAQLNHPNIVQVYAVGEQQGLLYMALEYVDGWTLKDFLQRKGPPDLPVGLSIMRQVAAALTRAAEVGVIHRDIKPENILMTRKVEVKVTDFGLSRIIGQGQGLNLTQTGTAMGTPLYMSPEQVMGQALDPRTDLYSFGATCYHLLSGQPPFTSESAMAVGIKHVQEEPVPIQSLRPDLPDDLCQLVHRLMAKNPTDRYQTAREVLKDLKRLTERIMGSGSSNPSEPLGGAISSTKLKAPEPRVQLAPLEATQPYVPPGRKSRPWLPWAVLASLLLAIGLGAAIGQWLKSTPELDPTLQADGQPTNPSGTTPLTPTTSSHERTNPPRKPTGTEPDKHERDLREKMDQTRLPIRPQMTTAGVRIRADLLHYYLMEPADFNKADNLADELLKSNVSFYKTLGYLSKGIISAQKDYPDPAIEWFMKAAQDEQPVDFNRPMTAIGMCRLHADLGKMVQDALEQVAKKKELPAKLKQLDKAISDRKRELRGPLLP